MFLFQSINYKTFLHITDIQCMKSKFSLKERKISLRMCSFKIEGHFFSIQKITVYFYSKTSENDRKQSNGREYLFHTKILITGLSIQKNLLNDESNDDNSNDFTKIIDKFINFLKCNQISKGTNGQIQLQIPPDFITDERDNNNFLFDCSEVVVYSFCYEL